MEETHMTCGRDESAENMPRVMWHANMDDQLGGGVRLIRKLKIED